MWQFQFLLDKLQVFKTKIYSFYSSDALQLCTGLLLALKEIIPSKSGEAFV